MKIIDLNGNERECSKIYVDPAYPEYMSADYESKRRPGQKHTEWYPLAEFLASNPGIKY